ncbi:MAG: ribose 5-phosphate isomerase B, partial [bacterium]
MKIALGCDHAGLSLKNHIKDLLGDSKHEVIDFGTDGSSSVDYPDFGRLVSENVSNGEADRGILICGTGIGMSIVANKFPHVRAALCYDVFTARMSRQHNDANILVLGGRITGNELAGEIVREWIRIPFEGGRHGKRLDKIEEIERLT